MLVTDAANPGDESATLGSFSIGEGDRKGDDGEERSVTGVKSGSEGRAGGIVFD
jgi:hypothetical protein